MCAASPTSGDQVAPGRVPAGKIDTRSLADDAAAAISTDKIPRSHRLAIIELDVDAGFVLFEAGHLATAMHRHTELFDPAREDRFHLVLPQTQPIGMPRRKVTDIQHSPAETCGLRRLPFSQESIGDPALVQDLDRARVEPSCTGSCQLAGRAPLHDEHVDARQSQLTCQHHSARAAPHHDHVCHQGPLL